MIHRSITVAVGPTRAFVAWTRHIHLWWPPGHTRHGGTIVLEAGRFVEETEAGEIPLGKVVEWSPPHRLVYDFFVGSSPEAPTRVHVKFVAIDGGTRVDIEHTAHLLGPDDFAATAGGFRRAWAHLIDAYTAHLESP